MSGIMDENPGSFYKIKIINARALEDYIHHFTMIEFVAGNQWVNLTCVCIFWCDIWSVFYVLFQTDKKLELERENGGDIYDKRDFESGTPVFVRFTGYIDPEMHLENVELDLVCILSDIYDVICDIYDVLL